MNNKEIEQAYIESEESFKKEFPSDFKHPFGDFKFVAIGYLDINEDFEKGEVPTDFITKLNELNDKGITLMTLGIHECEFCIDEGNYKNRGTSSSEKELFDKENKIRYRFPKMIFHYITEHKFKPSNEFISFVMNA